MQTTSDRVTLTIRVKAQSKENKLIFESDGSLIMYVAAPRTKGKANREMMKWLAKVLRKPTSNVRLVSGVHSDVKLVMILGLTQAEVASRLAIPLAVLRS